MILRVAHIPPKRQDSPLTKKKKKQSERKRVPCSRRTNINVARQVFREPRLRHCFEDTKALMSIDLRVPLSGS